MKPGKAAEILLLNLKEAGNKMPPDCKDALELAVKALYYVESVSEFPHLINEIPLPSQQKN